MKFAFWNTNNKSSNRYISSLVKDNQIDVLVLAEYSDDIDSLLDDLAFKSVFSAGCERVKIFTNNVFFEPGPQDSYYSFQIINNELILCCMHLTSKLYAQNELRRGYEIDKIIQDVNEIKNTRNINNIVFLGDMNENPYEQNILEAIRFHALPCRKDLEKESRCINGIEYVKYYNPMWNLLGDKDGPPGTYYHYSSSSPIEPFWHMLDQVIISKGVCERFNYEQLRIVTETSSGPLVHPDTLHPIVSISDHLPIVFEIGD